MVILDTTAGEEESDATKKGQENSTEVNRIGGWIMKEELFRGYACINNVFILLVAPFIDINKIIIYINNSIIDINNNNNNNMGAYIALLK